VSSSNITAPDIFERPRTRSVKMIGTSTVFRPDSAVRRASSIWNR